MKLLAAFGMLSFVVAGAVVGLRLLLLARRTRQRPELLVGGSLFAYAALAQPLVLSSRTLAAVFGDAARVAAVAAGAALMALSVAMFWSFTCVVFRRGAPVARAAVGVASLLAVVVAVALVVCLPETPGGAYGPGMKLALAGLSLLFSAGMGWTSVESLLYHAKARRRLAIGLAEPAVVDRFRLWGVGCGVVSVLSAAMLACVAAGLDVVSHPAPLLLSGVAGTVTAACWWLSFLPPAGYLRRVEARAAAT